MSITTPMRRMYDVSPVSTPLSMILALKPGQREGRRRLHGLQHDDQRDQPLVGAEVGLQQAAQHGRASLLTPCRNSAAICSGGQQLARDHRVAGRHRQGGEPARRGGRLDGDLGAVGGEHGDQPGSVGERAAAVEARPDAGHQPGDVERAALQDPHGVGDGVLQRGVDVDGAPAPARRPWDRWRASTTAAISSSLSAKTRKIVPSAMPAASAIWRVVTISPCSSSSGSIASMIIARRSSGGRDSARRPRGARRSLRPDGRGHGRRGYVSAGSLTASETDRVPADYRRRPGREPAAPAVRHAAADVRRHPQRARQGAPQGRRRDDATALAGCAGRGGTTGR